MGQNGRISSKTRRLLCLCWSLSALFIQLRAEEESDFEFEDKLEIRKEDVKPEKAAGKNATWSDEIDYLADDAGSGTGVGDEEVASGWIPFTEPIAKVTTTISSSASSPRSGVPIDGVAEYFRVIVNFTAIEYVAELGDRQSPAFQGLAGLVKQSVEELYRSVAGRQTAMVLQFRPGTLDPMDEPSVIATLDFSTTGYYNRLDLFNVLNAALNSGTLGSMTVSPHGFNFRPFYGGSSCPKQIGREPTSLPRLNDTKTNLMLNNRFVCDGLLTRLSYFRGSPDGHFYVGVWRQVTENIFLLKHRIAVPSASIGIHHVRLPTPLPVERGDFLGVHYPRSAVEGIIVYSIAADNVLPAGDMFRTLVVNAHDEDLSTDRSIDINRFSGQQVESKTFALIGFISNDTGACKSWQYLCDNGWCVERTRVCDGHNDCDDSSDERNCPTTTVQLPSGCDRRTEFTCEDGSCVDISGRCDGSKYDCADRSDEFDCDEDDQRTSTIRPRDCGRSEFSCGDGTCISSHLICDQRYDCPDGRDESACPETTPSKLSCSPITEFSCGDGTCVDISGRCDYAKYDCPDGTDEFDCDAYTSRPRCHASEFACGDGACIAADAACDRHDDCPDGSDERNCPDVQTPRPRCHASEFACDSGACIAADFVCNRHDDCPDGSDEWNCPIRPKCNSATEFTCGDGACVDISGRCDRTKYDCSDGTDEFNCEEHAVSCDPVQQFACGDRTCIDIRSKCDGNDDCPDGSDEYNCIPTEPSKSQCDPVREFTCRDGKCVDISGRCDRTKYDCADGTDEFDCDGYTPQASVCDPAHEFSCNDGSCVDIQIRCDGRHDCRDGSDERSCVISTALPARTCDKDTEFTCGDGSCVDISGRCDRSKYDCADGTDEFDCEGYTRRPSSGCESSEFRCNDGSCIRHSDVCDDRKDCPDGSDEENCKPVTQPTRCDPVSEFTCGDGMCVDISGRCDRTKYDCADGTDEFNCVDKEVAPPSLVCDHVREFTCNDGSCVDIDSKCDGHHDCRDGSDEQSCIVSTPAATCDPETEFTCGDGKCVDISGRCDRTKYDCADGTDEFDCDDYTRRSTSPPAPAPRCESSEFTCTDGSCIDQSYVCDDRIDCPDGSDEDNCKPVTQPTRCDPRSEFTCGDGKCVDISGRCDRTKYDCADGTDEFDCDTPPVCYPVHEFTCDDRRCVDIGSRCDGHRDCQDGSDERSCVVSTTLTAAATCDPDTEFTCGDGLCVDISERCDRSKYHCADGTDEFDCEGYSRPPPPACEFICNDGSCIDRASVCNNRRNCPDGSDEDNCEPVTQPTRCHPVREFTCGDGKCVDISGRCDRTKYDCADGTDEFDCDVFSTTVTPVCDPVHEFTCDDRRCVDVRSRCDGRHDCRDGSDERNCQPRCDAASEFTCHDGSCVDLDLRCDGTSNCDDDSDEEDCHCLTHQFRCTSGECVDEGRKCDGRNDCSDGSDERDCLSTETVVSVSPQKLQIRVGAEASFRCYMEGAAYSPTQWLRRGKDLPRHARDENGRLTISSAGVEDSGEYYCTASHVPGRPSASAQLIVEDIFGPTTARPRPPGRCDSNEAPCRNGVCIPRDFLCDADYDCTDRSDEENCLSKGPCEPNEFQCSNEKCILQIWRCDGDYDCADKSDERGCLATAAPGAPCGPYEFRCTRFNQCIPTAFHCDGETDCQDQSDEIGCVGPTIVKPPPSEVSASLGQILSIECEAIGVPPPLIVWRLNWGRVGEPPRVTYDTHQIPDSGRRGVTMVSRGVLTIGDARKEDEGAYTCEAMNTKGSVLAVPDAIVHVRPPHGVCRSPYFNDEAHSRADCVSCFCFGVTQDCTSSGLHLSQVSTSRLMSMVDYQTRESLPSSGDIFSFDSDLRAFSIRDYERSVRGSNYYWSLPSVFLGNKVTSYGGKLRYSIYYETSRSGRYLESGPDLIIYGNGTSLYHSEFVRPFSGVEQKPEISLTESAWTLDEAGRRPATRPDFMMVIQSIEFVLIKSRYERNQGEVRLGSVSMTTAGADNLGQGRAVLVEQCRCPSGYSGSSCERCSSGYFRRATGNYLGQCVRCDCGPEGCYPETGRCISIGCRDDAIGSRCDHCRPGYYAVQQPGTDAVRCIRCPCRQDSRGDVDSSVAECDLQSNGSVRCRECPVGFSGAHCAECAPGFERNADACEPARRRCDPRGSTGLPSSSSHCDCKRHVAGQECSVCRENSFHLSESNADGCLPCYCMGVTRSCTSSTLYRAQVRLSVQTEGHGGLVVTDGNRQQNFTDGFRVDPSSQDVVYRAVNGRRIPSDSFWLLPSKFLGNKVTSYGGFLHYTKEDVGVVDYPDVQIGGTGIVLQYRRGQHEEELRTMKAQFSEQYWTHPSGGRASRGELLIVLSNLDYVMIKAAHAIESRIRDIVMDTAERRNTGLERAYAVEECVCPVGHTGLSCESCDVGFWSVNRDFRIYQCQPCDCHGHSGTCDSLTGRCTNCQHNTEGRFCDVCVRGYYGDATGGSPSDCLPCPCPLTHSPNQFSPTCILDSDRLVTCTTCPSGHTGRRCERCLPGYLGNPQVQGDFCRPEDEQQSDIECDCNEAGTIPNTQCDLDTSQCQCKGYVEGVYCSECQPGYFFLSVDNPQGCLSCYCMGLTKNCTSSNRYRSQIEPDYVEDHGFRLTTRRLGEQIDYDITADRFTKRIEYDGLPQVQTEKSSLYWHLPAKFTGNQVASYGGYLNFQLEYTLARRESSMYVDADVELISGDHRFYLFLQSLPVPSEINTYSILLDESVFRQLDGTTPTRETFLKTLASLDAVLIRATHYSHMSTVALGHLALDTAVPYVTRQNRTVKVEQCSCPVGYVGLSCEQCAPGFSRVPDPSLPLGRCVRCDCNNHSSSCDIQTGACLDCRDHTTGDRCDQCETGYFGNPIGGASGDCQPCPCPLTSHRNRFSVTCYLDFDGQPTCDQCLPGYSGRQCERCALGYNGNPNVPGESCVKFSEENRPQISVSPKHHSVSIGGEANFRCSVEGGGGATQVQWIRADGRALPVRASVSGDFTLVLQRVESTDEGRYICIATNQYGKSQEEVRLTVSGERRLQVIVNHPKRRSVAIGITVQFNCTGFSQYTYTLAWSRQDGQRLSARITDDGQGILTIHDVQLLDAVPYVCTGSNVYSIATDTAILEISDEAQAPTARIEPRFLRAETGESIEFHCIATGIPAPRIRWSGGPGGQLPRDAVADHNVLRIESVASRHAGDYRCTAYNGLDSDVSTASLFVMQEATVPSFEIELSEQELQVYPGSEARISCSSQGNQVRVQRIEWTRDGGELPPGSYQGNGVLVIPQCEPDDSGTYVCTIFLVNGEKRVAYSTLVVKPDDIDISGLQLRTDPERQTVQLGSQATVRCLLTGASNLPVKWSRIRETLGPNHRVEGNVLTILRVSPEDRGQYLCEVENRYGRLTASAVLEVERHVAPVIEIYPRSAMTINLGASAMFQCHHTKGIPAPAITWQRADGRPFGRTVKVHEGFLEFEEVTAEDKGTYVCVAANSVGSSRATIALDVLGGSLQVSLVPRTQTLRPGDFLRLTCNVLNSQTAHVEWSKDQGSIPPTAIVGRNTLEILSVSDSDAGQYGCQAIDDRLGHVSHAAAEVIVLAPPSAVIAPRTLSVELGQSVEFTCEVTGHPAPTVQWDREGRDRLPSGHRIHGSKLLLSNVQPRDAGRYMCIVSNDVGTTRDFAQLRVLTNGGNGDSVRDQQRTVTVGDKVVIKCEVIGDIPNRVTWQKVGGEMPVTAVISDTELVFPEVELSDQGTYRCLATNVAATVYAQITIVVQGPPLVTLSRQTRTVSIGSNVTLVCLAGGSPTPAVSWSKRGGRLPRGSTIFNNTLYIVSIRSEDFGDFTCTARNRFGLAEGVISLLLSGTIPYFSQNPVSYHIYPGIRDAYANVDFEISFKPEAHNGLILYNGQSQGSGDFVSFGLRDGRAEFRFDAGAGPVTITTDPLSLNTWYTARARKYGKDGLLVVDGKEYRGQIVGRFSGLDLALDLYLGGVPDFRMVSREARYTSGFEGCISRLVVNGVKINIGDDALASVGVSNCPVCEEDRPCQHGGVCQPAASRTGYQCRCTGGYSGLRCELYGTQCERDTCGSYGQCHDLPDNQGYKCVCPLNKSGPRCEQGESVNVPGFNGTSYVAYPTIEDSLRETRLELTFNPKSLDNAILLYDAFDELGDNDFLALLIHDEHLEFRYNLGSGPAIIRSSESLRVGEWTKVLAEIYEKSGRITVNDGQPVTGQSSGTTVGLNLKTLLYVGGVDHGRLRLASDVTIDRGFHGCISKLKVKGREVDLVRGAIDSARVVECVEEHRERSPCHRLTPCRNGASCQDVGGASYRCICQSGFVGETCDIHATTMTSAEFATNSSYVELSSRLLIHMGLREEVIRMTVTTTSPEGVLLWQGQVSASGGRIGKDFIALSLEAGYVAFSYELGSGEAKLVSDFPINDGAPHAIVAKRKGKMAVLLVDDEMEVIGESGGRMTALNSNGIIYLGGVPNIQTTTGGRFRQQFSGCISEVFFQSRGPIDFIRNDTHTSNVTPCPRSR